MTDYTKFKAEDFLLDPSFRQWTAGVSAQAAVFWEHWLAQHPDHAAVVVKRRAYGLPVNAPSARDYKSLTDQTSATDAVLKNDPLKYERWAELFGEGHWWTDVSRWKIGDKEAAYYQKVRGGAIQWDSWDYAQPIPNNELNANVKQNTGYCLR